MIEDVKQWYEHTAPQLNRRGFTTHLHQRLDTDKPACWIDIDRSDTLARITVWQTGEAVLEMGDVVTGRTVSRQEQITKPRKDLDRLLKTINGTVWDRE